MYAAAARLEFHGNTDVRAARIIWERGLRRFAAAPAFALAYVDFLVGINDVRTAELVLRRALSCTEAGDAATLWWRLLRLMETGQAAAGSLQAVARVEEEYAAEMRKYVENLEFKPWSVEEAAAMERRALGSQAIRLLRYYPPHLPEASIVSTSADALCRRRFRATHPGVHRALTSRHGEDSRHTIAAPRPMRHGQKANERRGGGPRVEPPPSALPPLLARLAAALPAPRVYTGFALPVEYVLHVLRNTVVAPASDEAADRLETRQRPQPVKRKLSLFYRRQRGGR